MITTLYLLRHGETEESDVRRYKGSIDVPLSEKGFRQMERSSVVIKKHLEKSASSKYLNYVKDIHPLPENSGESNACEGHAPASVGQSCLAAGLQAVYTSNLTRALRSAEVIARPYGIQPVETAVLRERHFGVWEGMSFMEIREKYPAEFESWADNPLRYSPVGGETTIEVRDRVIPLMDSILCRHKGGSIAVVAHGGINRILLCHFLGIPLENIFRIEQDYAAVNIVEFWERYPVLKLVNG